MAKANGAVGTHNFDGACVPGSSVGHYETFSVGVFEWVAKAGGKGVKRSAVKVRVRGRCSDAAAVYAKAQEIAEALDAGTYTGRKTVEVR